MVVYKRRKDGSTYKITDEGWHVEIGPPKLKEYLVRTNERRHPHRGEGNKTFFIYDFTAERAKVSAASMIKRGRARDALTLRKISKQAGISLVRRPRY